MAIELGILRILHQHMARLRDAGEQLVNRLRDIGHRMHRPLALAAHRMEISVEGMEGGVGQPCLVEMQIVHIAVEHALDGLGVVEHAVVS